MRIKSNFIEANELHTYNKIQRMPRWEEANLARKYVQLAVDAWGEPEPIYTPCRFALEVVVRDDVKQPPDTDASFWIAKRVLDAAVLARIIPNDTFDTVDRIVLEAPMRLLDKSHSAKVCYRGVLTA